MTTPPQRQVRLRTKAPLDIAGPRVSFEIAAHAPPIAELRTGMVVSDERGERTRREQQRECRADRAAARRSQCREERDRKREREGKHPCRVPWDREVNVRDEDRRNVQQDQSRERDSPLMQTLRPRR